MYMYALFLAICVILLSGEGHVRKKKRLLPPGHQFDISFSTFSCLIFPYFTVVHLASSITMAPNTRRKKEESSPARELVQKKRNSRGGEFKCGLCGNEFSRASSIKNRHWAICVRRNGNPGSLVWDQDQSCWPKGKSGPSGTLAQGLTEQTGEDKEHKDGERMKEVGAMDETTDIEEALGSLVASYLMKSRYHN